MSLAKSTALLLSLALVTHLLTHSWRRSHDATHLWDKRSLLESSSVNQCDNIYRHDDQCAFVNEYCTDISPGIINYIHWYFCGSLAARPVILIFLCFWLLFLFGFVGIAASDFFCPNLQTIASALHLSESLTGVTFLAFGNGSPDLFSTFSAMQSNMGSLALGELIGAASFIVSVVAGSMCAIKPFRTKKLSFLRDVFFFTLAIILVMGIVADGLIHQYEAILLIVFYAVYVIVVVCGNYFMKRRSTYQNLVERARLEYEETGPEVDNLLRGNVWNELTPQEDEMELYDEGFETEGYQSDYARHRGMTHPKLRIRTSLFSAIEFQDVVQSLSETSRQYASPRYGLRHHPRYRHTNQDTRNRHISAHHEDTSSGPSVHVEDPSIPERHPWAIRLGRFHLSLGDLHHVNFRDIYFHLFPSLHNFHQKSRFSKVSSAMSAPVIFLLAITLPVVKESAIQRGDGSIALDDDAMALLQDIHDEDPMEMTDLSESTSEWVQWLTALQLVCAPLFLSTVLAINDVARPAVIIPTATATGIVLSIAFLLTTSASRQPRLYWMMSFVGFAMAITWIFVIANEVVGVLQAIGMALGISDAILGLTVFAVGNSLGDLVANVTMARMGYPMMAMSACFGGPMLNIMLGVGIGATYVTSQRNEPYAINVSESILVSAVGLLIVLVSSLVLVPLNGYRMSRMFGLAWIGIYLICTGVNLVLEIKR